MATHICALYMRKHIFPRALALAARCICMYIYKACIYACCRYMCNARTCYSYIFNMRMRNVNAYGIYRSSPLNTIRLS